MEEELSKEIADQQRAAQLRIKERQRKAMEEANKGKLTEQELVEKRQHEQLIGQLKAAEARNRLRIARRRNRSHQLDDLDELMQCQSTAAAAVRLEALLSPSSCLGRSFSDPSDPASQTTNKGRFSAKNRTDADEDRIDKITRERIERLMNDEEGLLIMRT